MYRIHSARPPFLSSVSRSCRYSTDKPAKSRGLITELKGISIPSLSELQEKARLREEKAKQPLDISYLQDAPNSSLAGRLAGRIATASKSQPKGKGTSLTPEELSHRTEQRRAARIARETAKANEALDQYKPNPMLAQKVANAAAAGNYGAVQPSKKNDTLPKSPPVAQPELLSAEKMLQKVVENRDSPKSKADKSKAEREPLLVQLEGPEEGGDIEVETYSEKDDAAPRRQRKSAAFEKKKEKLAQKLAFGDAKGRKGTQSNTLSPTQMKGVERRREERLRRESEDRDEPKSPRKQKSRASRSADIEMQRLSQEKELDETSVTLDEKYEEKEEEDRITPGFTGPEPVSTTLVEFFKETPMLQSLSPAKAPTVVTGYSSYIPPSTEALFPKPIEDLSAVDIATVALSHRADINLRQRKQALSTIATATRSRSSQTEARA